MFWARSDGPGRGASGLCGCSFPEGPRPWQCQQRAGLVEQGAQGALGEGGLASWGGGRRNGRKPLRGQVWAGLLPRAEEAPGRAMMCRPRWRAAGGDV